MVDCWRGTVPDAPLSHDTAKHRSQLHYLMRKLELDNAPARQPLEKPRQ